MARWGFVCASCGCYVDEALRATRGEHHKPGCDLDPGERWSELDHDDVKQMLVKNVRGERTRRRAEGDGPPSPPPAAKAYPPPPEENPVRLTSVPEELPLPPDVRKRLQELLGS
jgi:hypothetical protein